MQQLEANRPNLIETRNAGDPDQPMVIEVIVEKDGPVSLELLTKLLIVGVVFLATRHIAPSVAIVGAILSAFLPDVITATVRRRRWGKKRVGILAVLATFFATLDSAFGKAIGRLVPERARRALGSRRGGPGKTLGLGHAVTTTAVAATVCAIAIAVPALASGGSPFATSPVHPHTQTGTHTGTQTGTRTGTQTGTPPSPPVNSATHDVFRHVQISPTGVPGSVSLSSGQQVHLQFSLAQPSKLILALGPANTVTSFSISRDGGQDPSSSIAVDSTHPYIPAVNLSAGNHTITISPATRHGGTLSFVLYASSDLTRAVGVSSSGVPGSVTVTPGQRVHLQFVLPAPSKVVFAIRAQSTLTNFAISHDGGQDPSSSIAVDSTHPYIPAGNLSAGTHTITIEPAGISNGTLNYILSASNDLTQTIGISAAGTPGSITLTAGQRAHLQFTLAQPSKVVFAVGDGSTLTQFGISRDGGQDPSSSIAVDATDPYIPAGDLSAGSHTITIEASGDSAGTLRFIAYASTDLAQPADISADGVPGSVTVTPGQRAHLEFTLKQPSQILFRIDPNSTLTAYGISRDSGQDPSSSIAIDSNNPYAPATVLAPGTHTITIEPTGAAAGTLLYTLATHTD